jgi:Secretion system C-terminal sorting domain
MRLLLTLCLFAPAFSFSQIFSTDVISSNGESTTSGTASLTWTVGEIAIESYTYSNGYLTEGFHQCWTCGPVSINEIQNNLAISTYPNPFLNSVIIDIPNNTDDLDLVVFDALGKIVLTEKYSGNSPIEYDLRFLSSGMYVLQLYFNDGTTQSKKLQKQ